ncbi:ectoine/hydroxyectoine ABC transporter permease subunit EhuC [Brachybacterium saurashtrense]|uniref:Ectoine/hydroxyectoine ABC transporter permease subunit EhuC n=1 Tax=Brachybacterium saurashtrense TaxID=556288 RepID=A0A345YK74_9MICO|nr:ectoine/hydroxyectoine ABC transporter permease subunit EhuC [Brachybacterium saurashtrense]AXK44326.1 ectoine/hydroxyectoine ABC transporter permease subunit EhuC [Brachybacterium saurashtrense]RRR21362.1 ectoine/hydroxyectoine ABC transporter permease subunit EhuC [Brachybacterium saurashtrense]RRR22937.1 ectoine/hydroxyectoine ABC transporter permease subunit EhuC [Brachybacterium saurashtrense]
MDGVIGFVEDLGPNLQLVLERMPMIVDGVITTMQATVLGALLALVIAFVFGLAQISKLLVVRVVARVFVEFFRGTSLVVQLFWLAFVMPQLPYPLGFQLEPMLVAVLALGLNYGAYAAEVVRGSIGSVPKGQYEAISALSLSPARGMFRIVIPQAWALMIPSLSNLWIQLLKGSAIVNTVLLYDLFFQVEQLRDRTGTWFAYIFALLAYYLLAWLIVILMNGLEIRAKHRIGRGPGLTENWRALFQAPGTTPSGKRSLRAVKDKASARVATTSAGGVTP